MSHADKPTPAPSDATAPSPPPEPARDGRASEQGASPATASAASSDSEGPQTAASTHADAAATPHARAPSIVPPADATGHHTDAHDAHDHTPRADTPRDLARLAIAALGVVYGDIGTSPLYAVKECFGAEHGLRPTPDNVLGILSLVFWSLLLVIVGKYLSYIMRADNRGEGGILALMALASPRASEPSRARTGLLMLLGLFGAALLYGDGMITPAISVLSAVEGLEVAAPSVHRAVVPITVAILIGLFLMQKRGTASVGAIFGPATLLWFIAIAVTGLPWIAAHPGVFEAINPMHAVHFFVHHRSHGFLVLGSVVLCITGGEALYADMGHFGRRPIRLAWYAVVLPALLLNYFGQGAMLLSRCGDVGAHACTVAAANPFYGMISGWLLYPMVAIATVATVVASQALISGAFSLTQQAVQLGYCPRVTIVHTSDEAAGQIFIPEINTALMVACVALVLVFKESSALAAAYGIAVTGTMGITSVLFYAVARTRWNWSILKAGALVALFLLVDVSFFAANAAKLARSAGAWFPLAVGGSVFALMVTWKRGRAAMAAEIRAGLLPLDAFLAEIPLQNPPRVSGTAVFMTANPEGTPPALLHHFKHNKVLHKQVVLLNIRTEEVPEVSPRERVTLERMEHGFWFVTARFGFMQTPNMREILRAASRKGLRTVEADTSFYLGRETLLTTGRSGMARWRKVLFVFMSRNARPATAYFGLPPNRVVELGTQIEL